MARGKNKLQKKERVASKLPIPTNNSSNSHSHHRSSSSINYHPTNQTKLEALHSKARRELISSSSQALKAAQEATEVLSASITSKGTTHIKKNSVSNANSISEGRARSSNLSNSISAGRIRGNNSRISRINQEDDTDSLLGEDEFNHTGEDDCDHSSLSSVRMKKVATLLSDLFSSSFRVAVPCLYRGLVQKFQDQVLKDRILRFIDEGASPELILKQSSSPIVREKISTQLRLACSTELADVVLRLSTEDTFDLLCDLSLRHGRDIKLYGPPCACSFSRCLPCLERLVSSIKTTPQSKPPEIKRVKVKEMEEWMEEYWQDDEWEDDELEEEEDIDDDEDGNENLDSTGKISSNGSLEKIKKGKSDWKEQWNRSCDLKDKIQGDNQVGKKKDLAWKDAILGAWKQMADTLFETASSIDPLSLPRVKGALEALKSINGLDLYYTIVTREVCGVDSGTSLASNPSMAAVMSARYQTHLAKSAAANASNPIKSDSTAPKPTSNLKDGIKNYNLPIPKEVAEAVDKGIGFSGLAVDLIVMKSALDQREKDSEDKKGEKEKELDFTGRDHRKALGRAIREQGNAAYSAGHYLTSIENYTRAIGYDSTEPIYPLNRAACLLKLKRYAEGERDCSAALMLDETNYKAHFRRGVCRAGLGKKEEAKEDFETVLKMQQGNPQAQEELRKLSAQFLNDTMKVPNILASREAQFGSTTKTTAANSPSKATPRNPQQSKPSSQPATKSVPQQVPSKGKAKLEERVAICSPDSSPETSTRRLPNSRPSSPLFNFSSEDKPSSDVRIIQLSDSEEEEEVEAKEEIDSEGWESGSSRGAENTNGTEATSASNDSAGGNVKEQPRRGVNSKSSIGISLAQALSFVKTYASGKNALPPSREVLESKPISVKKSNQYSKDWKDMELYEKSVVKIRSAHPEEWLKVPDDLMGAIPTKDQSKFDVMVNSITHSNLSFQDIQSLIFKTLSSESPHALQAIEEAVKRAVEKHRAAHIQLGFAMAFSTVVAQKTGSMKAFDGFKNMGWAAPSEQEVKKNTAWFEQKWKEGMVRNIL